MVFVKHGNQSTKRVHVRVQLRLLNLASILNSTVAMFRAGNLGRSRPASASNLMHAVIAYS